MTCKGSGVNVVYILTDIIEMLETKGKIELDKSKYEAMLKSSLR